MKQEHDNEIDRHPWRIKQRNCAVTGYKLPQARKVSELCIGVARSDLQGMLKSSLVNQGADQLVNFSADGYQHSRSQHLRRRQTEEHEQRDEREHGQRGETVGPDCLVINVQHKKAGTNIKKLAIPEKTAAAISEL